MARRVPVSIAADALYEGFSEYLPDLLGECSDRDSYRDFALSAYSAAFAEGANWVIVRSEPGSHIAELHVYSFDHSLSKNVEFFKDVLRELALDGKHRVFIPLMPGVGRTVRRVLSACGFALEGIMRDYYRNTETGTFANAEVWVTLLEGENDGR